MKWLMVVVVVVATALVFSFGLLWSDPAQNSNNDYQIRSEVLGAVAPGTIYTTLLNLNDLEPNLPKTQSSRIVLNEQGDLIEHELLERGNVIDYQQHPSDRISYGVFTGDLTNFLGVYHVLDPQGIELARLSVKDNPNTDLHGIVELRNGNFIVPSYKLHTLPGGQKVESFLLEEQTVEGEVVFLWDSLDAVGLGEANYTERRAYWIENNINDYFHGNSVAEDMDGNLLVSGRHTNSIIKIDRQAGEVLWRLGGSQSDFTFIDDPLGGFSHQHSVHALENGHILIYDNGNLHSTPTTRIVEYELDETTMTARLVWSYQDGRFTYATGSVQRLSNGHTLIGWGLETTMSSTTPRITEVDTSGKPVLHIYFPDDSGFYNVFKL